MKNFHQFFTPQAIIERKLDRVLARIPDAQPDEPFKLNLLIEGDNLVALKALLKSNLAGQVDLVYIDPPYATGQVFSVDDDRSSTISRSRNGKTAYDDRLTGIEFLEFLHARIVLLHALLADTGSFYLHIDSKIGHYVKIVCDEVFGMDCFRNDISRIKCNPKNFSRIGYGNIKDLILFYTKTDRAYWNEPQQAYSESDLERLFPKRDVQGRAYTTIPLHAPGETASGPTSAPFKGQAPPKGRHWRTDVQTLEKWDEQGLIEWSKTGNPRKIIYADEQTGKRVQDVWEFKDPQYPVYPTEKNLDMLRLIVRTSCPPDGLVLDAFCGSGTALAAAQAEGRNWIGIDQSPEALAAAARKVSSSGLFEMPLHTWRITL
jgi:adenine-specific DNA-methyltransferase